MSGLETAIDLATSNTIWCTPARTWRRCALELTRAARGVSAPVSERILHAAELCELTADLSCRSQERQARRRSERRAHRATKAALRALGVTV